MQMAVLIRKVSLRMISFYKKKREAQLTQLYQTAHHQVTEITVMVLTPFQKDQNGKEINIQGNGRMVLTTVRELTNLQVEINT